MISALFTTPTMKPRIKANPIINKARLRLIFIGIKFE